MKLEINLEKKWAFGIVASLLILSGIIFVVAYTYNGNIPNPGHGADTVWVDTDGDSSNGLTGEETLQEAINNGDLGGSGGNVENGNTFVIDRYGKISSLVPGLPGATDFANLSLHPYKPAMVVDGGGFTYGNVSGHILINSTGGLMTRIRFEGAPYDYPDTGWVNGYACTRNSANGKSGNIHMWFVPGTAVPGANPKVPILRVETVNSNGNRYCVQREYAYPINNEFVGSGDRNGWKLGSTLRCEVGNQWGHVAPFTLDAPWIDSPNKNCPAW